MGGIKMGGKVQRFSEEEKLEIIMMVFKDSKKLDLILGKYSIGRATYYKWRNRFLQAGKEGLKDYKSGPGEDIKRSSTKEIELEKELETAKRRIDELAIELEVVKKKRKLLGLE
jgi:transposase-like protein